MAEEGTMCDWRGVGRREQSFTAEAPTERGPVCPRLRSESGRNPAPVDAERLRNGRSARETLSRANVPPCNWLRVGRTRRLRRSLLQPAVELCTLARRVDRAIWLPAMDARRRMKLPSRFPHERCACPSVCVFAASADEDDEVNPENKSCLPWLS